MVKVQLWGMELFSKKGTLFEEESYLAKINEGLKYLVGKLLLEIMHNFLSKATIP